MATQDPSLFLKPTPLCYLRIVRSCRSSQFWRCRKPPESGLLAEAAFPALPKIHSYLVTGERDPGTDSSTLDGCCPPNSALTPQVLSLLSPTPTESPTLMSTFTPGFRKPQLAELVAGTCSLGGHCVLVACSFPQHPS